MLNPWSKSLLIPYARIIEFRFQGLSRCNRNSQLLSTPSHYYIIEINIYNTNIRKPEKQFATIIALLAFGGVSFVPENGITRKFTLSDVGGWQSLD